MGLIALCLSVYLPGLWTIPPVDRDESRFAQASRQMVESGDWVMPRVENKPRLNKPPLIYWLQSGSVAVFGDEPGRHAHGNIWVFRVPSVLAAIGTVLLTWRLGLRMFDPRAAWLGAAMLAVCPMVVWDAHQARADQLLLLTSVAAQGALWVIWRRELGRRRAGDAGGRAAKAPLLVALGFWLAIAAGVLAKGPITPMIAAFTALGLCMTTRCWRWLQGLRPLLGLAIVAAAVMPWLVALTHRLGDPSPEFREQMQRMGLTPGSGESGWAIYARIVFDETLGRSASPKEGHWGPPGYHLVVLTVLLWPGSLLTGLALARGFRQAFPALTGGGPTRRGGLVARLRSPAFHPASRFLLCWIAPSWLVFELISTKLPHYTMPLYPALALLSARAVFAAHRGVLKGLRDRGTRVGFVIWWLVGVAATVGLTVVVVVAGRVDSSGSLPAAFTPYVLPLGVVVLTLVAAGRSLTRGFYLRAQIQSLAAVVLWGATFLQFVLPGAERFWISNRVVEAADSRRLSGPLVNLSDFTEDSLVFLTRGRLTTVMPTEVATGERVAVVWPATGQAPSVAGERLSWLSTIRGWNYSNGKLVELHVSELDRTAPAQP